MKTLEVLKKILIQESTILLNELSSGIKKTMLDKFRDETNDPDEEITKMINSFEKFQNSSNIIQKDITKYKYEDLKTLILSIEAKKQTSKQKESAFSYFKSMDPSISIEALKRTIKYFNEIKDELLPENSNYKSYKNFVVFEKMVEDNYSNIIKNKLLKKFKTDADREGLILFINAYLDVLFDVPSDKKSVLNMTYNEFENFVEEINPNLYDKDYSKGSKEKYEGIEKVYDKDNLVIYAPKTRDECIRLRNGRSWCITWLGTQNRYYHYRLGERRTVYVVIDYDLPYEDLNFASVILVDPDGGMSLADASNSGKYSGHQNIPWDEIVEKIPKIQNLKKLFIPRPLSDEEKQMTATLRTVNVGDNPIKDLGGEKQTEIWLEYVVPTLSDAQYSNLTPDLKKKYISISDTLSDNMVENSEPSVISYYINRRFEHIKNAPIKDLTKGDISLLKLNIPKMKELRAIKIEQSINTIRKDLKKLTPNEIEFLLLPEMVKVKNSMRKEIIESIPELTSDVIDIRFPNSDIAKVITLYPDYNFFESVPKTVTSIIIENIDENSNITISVPDNIGNYTNLSVLSLRNIIKTLPESIKNCKKLQFLNISDNKNLVSLPESLIEMKSYVDFINLDNLPNLDKKSQKIKKIIDGDE